MTIRTVRYINSRISARQVPDLLQAIFTAELIAPSSCLWIVSPWISDIPIIDNSANAFICIEPSWSRRSIRLAQILSKLADVGTTVHIATRPLPHNDIFIRRLATSPTTNNIQIHLVEELHEKGIVGDSFYLGGSMNFTHNGITINEEAIIYETTPEVVVERQVIFKNRWGGKAR
jgi:hypothetical protein